MSFLSTIRPSPLLRPMFNLGFPFDIPTGGYELGKYGESLLNAGLTYITGIGGRGNVFKSTIADNMLITVLDRYESDEIKYDTEISASVRRQRMLSAGCENLLKDVDIDTCGRFVLTDKAEYNGTEFYDLIRKGTEDRLKPTKAMLGTTPFLDRDGSFVKTLHPRAIFVDSFSMFSSANVLKIQDENGIGASDRNTEALRDAGSKTQMMLEMPTLAARQGLYFMLTAHMGDEHALDPRSPPQKKLAFLKSKIKFKNVPEKFTLLTNNCWVAHAATVLKNDKTGKPKYPKGPDMDVEGLTDLMTIMFQCVRGKYGLTGMTHEIVLSQTHGVHRPLSCFVYLDEHERFGIVGTDRNYTLALCPDTSLQRTTIRGKFDSDYRLRRAAEIQAEILQMSHYWTHIDRSMLCDPAELYSDLKQKGYNWDQLLDTRGWWTFDNDKHPIAFLSTWDLLMMRKGLYKPYWLK